MSTELTHSFRCPSCDGLNDLDAEWCMQCGRRFERAEAEPEAVAPVVDEGGFSARQAVADSLDLVAGGEGDLAYDDELGQTFSVHDKNVTWTCARCSHRNDIKANQCEECGRTFIESAGMIAATAIPEKRYKASLKAIGIVTIGAVVMRLVASLISPWAAAAVLAAAVLRFLLKYLRA